MSEERNPIGTRSIVFPEQHASTVDEYRSEDAINQAPICVEGHCITCSDEALQVRVLSLDCDTGVALVELGEKTEEVDVSLVEEVAPGDLLLVHGGVAIASMKTVSEE
jgi:hydrogenase expression/formation protein HypC